MKYLVQISRFLVGVLFIFSGWVKLNDPMGFGFKLEEYFVELNMSFLLPAALFFAIFICVIEIALGITLLLGLWRKLTVWALLLMIVFFTFLTFWSWWFNVVTDCGCFGDAIPLEPYESFIKDVILTVLIVILFAGKRFINPLVPSKTAIGITGVLLIACGFYTNHVLNHLPVVDFRAYKIGTDIAEGMKSAEELGLEGPQYEIMYTLKNASTGEMVEITDKQYIDDKWWEKPEWEIQNDLTESRKVSDGYEPPIHDFSLNTDTGDITQWLLSQDAIVMVLSYEMEKASEEGMKAIGEWAWNLDEVGIQTIGWTSSSYEVVEAAKHEAQIPIDFTTGDGTAIKTVIRSNPGVVALQNGVIVGKWHWNDAPSVDELQGLFQ